MEKESLLSKCLSRNRTARLTALFLAPFLAVLLAFLAYVAVREERMAEEAQLSELRESARSFYELIAVARLWNAEHGGVYAKVTERTAPNPYLDDRDRDIVTASGDRYTKINPAYMTRQLSEVAARRSGVRFRLVSLKPVNPANAPDRETERALREFEETGATERALLIGQNGGRVYRYLVPLKIEEPCLRCHAKQGYRAGEIKGGIEITTAMGKYDEIRAAGTRRIIWSLCLIGALSIVFTALVTWYLSNRLSREISKNAAREKLEAAVALAGATAHEMRQPMTIVKCMLGIVKEKQERGEPVTEQDLDIVYGQCDRMNGIIERLLSVTEYKTKPYCGGAHILDLEESAGGGRV